MQSKTRRCGRRGILLAVSLGLPLLCGVPEARAQGGVDGVGPPPIIDDEPIGRPAPASAVQPITDVVPLWGKKLRDDGVDLPLPFGVGLTYSYINQNTKVYDLQIEGRPLGVSIPDSKTTSHTVVL